MGVWDNSDGDGGRALVAATVEKADGTVVDVTADILQPGSDVTIRQAGRQTELSRVEPGAVDLALNNASGRYTPGYAPAPTALEHGMPLRWKETVGRRSFDLFNGTLSQPEATFENLDGTGDQVRATAVDWMGQQEGGRKFISTLAEYIMYYGGATLAAYWPLTEPATPFLDVVGGQPEMLVETITADSGLPLVLGSRNVAPASADGPRNDDARLVRISTVNDGIVTLQGPQLTSTPAVSISPGQVMTLLAWYKPEFPTTDQIDCLHIQGGTGSDYLQIDFVYNAGSDPGRWKMTVSSGSGLSGTIVGPEPITDQVHPIAIRYGYSPSVMELWVNRRRYIGSLTGTPPSGATTTSQVRLLSFGLAGVVGHAQLYAGAAAGLDFDAFQAQRDHAVNPLTGGLRFQRSDERLLTLAQYAGLPAARSDFDRGEAYMARAALAGKDFRAAAQEVVDTEQGRLFVTGAGNLRFHNRATTKYDV